MGFISAGCWAFSYSAAIIVSNLHNNVECPKSGSLSSWMSYDEVKFKAIGILTALLGAKQKKLAHNG